MDSFKIERTYKTPEVNLDPKAGVLKIHGRSIAEHPIEFYKPVMEWIEEYKSNAQPKTVVDMELEYFNTSSFRVLLTFFKNIAEIHTGDQEVEINWRFEEGDESVMEAGEQYQALVDIPFNLVEIES